jgi:sporulation protein YlmC with PRC-barrel domain
MRVKDDIVGKEVVDINGIVIGKVKDVEVDFETQLIRSFVVGKGGFNIRSSGGEIILSVNVVRVIGDKLLLNTAIND